MNKKFSTFFATIALLIGVVFASNAQTYTPPSNILTLNATQRGDLYQIAINNGASEEVLAIDGDGNLVIVDVTTTLPANLELANTLWCISIEAQDQGINPVYQFLNKGTGEYLGVNMQDISALAVGDPHLTTTAKVGGEIISWKFSDKFNNQNINTSIPLYAFYTNSYVVGLNVDEDASNVKRVYWVKQEVDNNNNVVSDVAVSTNENALTQFTVQTSRSLKYLTAKEFNEVIGNQDAEEGVSLVFDKNLPVNPFAGVKLFAETATTFSPLFSATTDGYNDSYLYIRDANNNYLMVDTAYYSLPGENRYLKYKWVDLSDKNDAVYYLDNDDNYRSHYMFRFEYFPTPNNLEVEVAGLLNVDTRANGSAWAYWPEYMTSGSSSLYQVQVSIWAQSYASTGESQLTVSSIDAVDNYQNVVIGFAGFEGCTPSNDKTSLPTDLYVITDGKGKYLAAPLKQTNFNEQNGSPVTPGTDTRTAEWVTLERNENPWTMPGYQWVVEKTQTATALQSTSPVKITNREYANIVVATGYQLYVDSERPLLGAKLTVENFERDTKGVKADPYVGYRHLDKDSLLIAGYTFKYLHEAITDDLYLSIGGLESDSVIYAGQKVVFAIDTIPTEFLGTGNGSNTLAEDTIFGYTPLRTVNNQQVPLAGWSKLQRRLYTLKVKGAAKDTYVVLDDENRYAVTTTSDWRRAGEGKTPVRFYLKANNEKNGEIYYALVDYSTNNTNGNNNSTPSLFQTPKAGVDDNSLILNLSPLSAERTSAFAVEIDDTPLYRRFKNDPAEGVAARAIDTPDTMRFFEKYRKEYLQMESNPNFTVAGIDFLGINAKSEAKGGISFIVDSAWIGRGLGYIKPQYLISIDRNDQPAVDAIPCPEEFHGNAPDGTPYDQWTCPHATKGTPGFNRGRYLINFEFPGYGVKDDADNDYVWKKFYRAGFVEAVHMGDSLYILRDEFAGLPNNRIDTAAIKAAEAAWRKDKKKAASDYYYIVNLQGDVHKFVTWSMRYLDPNHTATDNSFLMESVSETITIKDAIAPTMGAWLKMQNGCLVLSDREESEFKKETAGDDALIFNVEYVDGDELATDDEVIAESSVVVIAGQGTVTVKNAAGKKVAISNILGQTVANTVVTSDNATIAVPAGVVVVAVEGEAAVKAIVK